MTRSRYFAVAYLAAALILPPIVVWNSLDICRRFGWTDGWDGISFVCSLLFGGVCMFFVGLGSLLVRFAYITIYMGVMLFILVDIAFLIACKYGACM